MNVLGETVTFSVFDSDPIPSYALYEECAFVDIIDNSIETLIMQEQVMECSELNPEVDEVVKLKTLNEPLLGGNPNYFVAFLVIYFKQKKKN